MSDIRLWSGESTVNAELLELGVDVRQAIAMVRETTRTAVGSFTGLPRADSRTFGDAQRTAAPVAAPKSRPGVGLGD